MKSAALHDLLKTYHQHPTPEAMEQLVEGFLPIPKAIAARFSGHGIEYDDLFQVASMALMKAIQRFEPDKGFQFVTYATPTIVGDLRNYIRDKNNLVKASRSAKNLLYNINKVKDEFVQTHFREPDIQDLSELLNVDRSEIINALLAQNSANIVSLDSSIDDESSDTLSAFIGYDEEGYNRLENEGFMEWIKSHTSSQEYQLLLHRFLENLSQRETAKLLQVSQMQVSRLEKRILNRLKSFAHEIQ